MHCMHEPVTAASIVMRPTNAGEQCGLLDPLAVYDSATRGYVVSYWGYADFVAGVEDDVLTEKGQESLPFYIHGWEAIAIISSNDPNFLHWNVSIVPRNTIATSRNTQFDNHIPAVRSHPSPSQEYAEVSRHHLHQACIRIRTPSWYADDARRSAKTRGVCIKSQDLLVPATISSTVNCQLSTVNCQLSSPRIRALLMSALDSY
eukprot:COSAG02_NODE_985_length_15457_cov_108.738247_1_plen_203_part_10